VHAGSAPAELKAKIGKEGARTIPGRPEHGGNCDIKNLSRGSKVFLPVHVTGAKFSVGDLHFSQGDGEISFCGAIEMAGVITLKFSVMKDGMAQLGMKSPIYIPGPVEPQFGPGRYIYFEGFSVDEQGKQHYLDTTVAYRQTCLRVIEYLRRYGEFYLSFLLSLLFFWGLCVFFPLLSFVSFSFLSVKKSLLGRGMNMFETHFVSFFLFLLEGRQLSS
jgi:formamidase